jgi:acyl carrier protein
MSDFYAGLAEIFEVSPVEIGPGFDLVAHTWDSLAIVSTLALIDECFNQMVEGKALAACVTVSDIEVLVGARAAKVA